MWDALGQTAARPVGAADARVRRTRSLDGVIVLTQGSMSRIRQIQNDLVSEWRRSIGGHSLDGVLDMLLQWVAVFELGKKATGRPTPTPLLLNGSPGIGKTMITQVLGGILGLPVFRIELYSVFAPWELAGSPVGWTNAKIGIIAEFLLRANGQPALFVWDELDKLAAGSHWGNPATVLMRFFDPGAEFFEDLHLGPDQRFDIRLIQSIATSNSLEPIPEPLKNRMKIIEVPEPSVEDRIDIANRVLLPRLKQRMGLDEDDFRISENVLARLIANNREPGIRKLSYDLEELLYHAVQLSICRGRPLRKIATENVHLLGLGDHFEEPTEIARDASSAGVATVFANRRGDYYPVRVEACITRPSGNAFTYTPGNLDAEARDAILLALSTVSRLSPDLGLPERIAEASHHVHLDSGLECDLRYGPTLGPAVACALISLWRNERLESSATVVAGLELSGRLLPIPHNVVAKIARAASRYGIQVLSPTSDVRSIHGAVQALRTGAVQPAVEIPCGMYL
jgi:ATP-dependent Lon protease